MAQNEQATTPKGLWLLVVLPLIVLAIEMQTNYVLVRQACSVQRSLMLHAVIVIAILLAIGTALVAVSIWRRAGPEWPTEASDLANRIRFISVLGILSSAMSLVVIVAQGIATIHFDPCQL